MWVAGYAYNECKKIASSLRPSPQPYRLFTFTHKKYMSKSSHSSPKSVAQEGVRQNANTYYTMQCLSLVGRTPQYDNTSSVRGLCRETILLIVAYRLWHCTAK